MYSLSRQSLRASLALLFSLILIRDLILFSQSAAELRAADLGRWAIPEQLKMVAVKESVLHCAGHAGDLSTRRKRRLGS